jgi:hypothetical protein
MKKFKKALTGLVALVTLVCCAPVGFAGEPMKDIILECSYKSTTDLKDGSMSETIDTKLLTVKRSTGSKVILSKEGLGAEFRGSANDAVIVAETAYQMGNLNVKEGFKINRYTGQFENSVLIGSGGLMHRGVCSSSQKKF